MMATSYWLKPKDAALYAGVSERTLRDWLKQGLKYSRIRSGRILINKDDIDAFLEQYSITEDRAAMIANQIINDIC